MTERAGAGTALARETDRGGVLATEAGQVVCPRRGLIDIEGCWDCREFGGQAADGETLVCRWSGLWTLSRSLMPAPAMER
jgi:hypothetical protein